MMYATLVLAFLLATPLGAQRTGDTLKVTPAIDTVLRGSVKNGGAAFCVTKIAQEGQVIYVGDIEGRPTKVSPVCPSGVAILVRPVCALSTSELRLSLAILLCPEEPGPFMHRNVTPQQGGRSAEGQP
jgi:hypothetical protein